MWTAWSTLVRDVSSFLVRVVLLLAVLVAATTVGLFLRTRAGRARAVSPGDVLTAADLSAPLGDGATFVQFSSPACSPCRAVRGVLEALVAQDPQLGHVEVDAAERLDLARRFAVLRTPTVLVLDHEGHVVRRISGALTPAQARAALPDRLRS
jgi:thiol-disulfide isomerase/thioredoxin